MVTCWSLVAGVGGEKVARVRTVGRQQRGAVLAAVVSRNWT